MWQKIKEVFIMYRNIFILILFCISLMCNVGLLIGKGLTFNMKSEAIANSYSNASSASMVITGLGDVQNKKFIIKNKHLTRTIFSNKTHSEYVTEFLNTLTPLQFCFAKVVDNEIYYIEFEEK